MMNATLLDNPEQSACGFRREAELTALVEKLLGEVAQLRGEVAELRQQAGYWKGMFEQTKRKNEKLQKEIDSLRAENRQLKDKLFAAKSEKKPSKDRSNRLDDPKAVDTPPRPRGHQPNTPGPRRRDYSHLPIVEEFAELPSDETACPKCGKLAADTGETEDSEVIEVDVHAHRRKIRRKRYRPTCDCADTPKTLTAPAPPKLIPKGRYGVSVWVHVLLAKFASHRALGNALEALSHYGLDLPQGTITDGLKRITPLLEPVYEAILARNAESFYRQADETRWSVFVEQEGKIGYRWWLWGFLGEDTTAFRLEPTRARCARGALRGRGQRHPYGRSLLGLQGDGPSPLGCGEAGVLLGPCASRFHRRRQGLAGTYRLGRCVAKSHSPPLPSESATAFARSQDARVCPARHGFA